MIQKDKKLHFLACAAITFMVMLIFSILNTPITIAAFTGILTSTASAWGKEYGDKCNPYNKWDWKDIIADSLGTIGGLVIGSTLWLL